MSTSHNSNQLAHDLNIRVKELKCLFTMSKIVEQADLSRDELIQEMVDTITLAWEYPNRTCAKITLKNKDFKTTNYKASQWKLVSEIVVDHEKAGNIEVCLLNKPTNTKEPFTAVEKDLLISIAERLGRIIERIQAQQELQTKNQELFAANQQLMASEQQLKAANQQLTASEQQLKAANQQLTASEQQLAAGNQQLRASIQQLTVNEEKYRLISENVEAVLWEFDIPLNQWTYVGPQVKRLLGYEPFEFTDLQFWIDHIDETDRTWASEYCAEKTKKGKSHKLEYRFLKKDGTPIWIRDIVHVETKNKKAVIMRGLMIDITEQKQADEEIKRSQGILNKNRALLHAIIESPQGMIVFALDNDYRYTVFTSLHKQIMLKIWGVEIEIGMNMLDVIKLPSDRKKVQNNFDKTLQGKHLKLIEEYGSESLNRSYWENRYAPIYNNQKEIVGLSVFVLDISERIKAEEEIKEKLDKLQQWHQLSIGREVKMIELKKEINELLKKAGLPEKYEIASVT